LAREGVYIKERGLRHLSKTLPPLIHKKEAEDKDKAV
jgi:hypothetical protein